MKVMKLIDEIQIPMLKISFNTFSTEIAMRCGDFAPSPAA